MLALKARLVTDNGWDYYPRDPLAQRIHHLLADRFLGHGSELRNAHHLARVTNVPVVIVANHLSYADANVIEVLLQRAGGAALAGRLTALAGPKVFTSRERRFSSLCFGTVNVPKSAEVASGNAVQEGVRSRYLYLAAVAASCHAASARCVGRVAGMGSSTGPVTPSTSVNGIAPHPFNL